MLDVDVEVEVTSGTYVRALARDLGAALGVGGHLTALRRTRVGSFTLDQAHTLPELEAAAETGTLPVLLLADAARSGFAVRELTQAEATAVGYGQRIASAEPGRTEPVAAFAPDGTLVAMLDESGHKARAHVVFALPAPECRRPAPEAPAAAPARHVRSWRLRPACVVLGPRCS